MGHDLNSAPVRLFVNCKLKLLAKCLQNACADLEKAQKGEKRPHFEDLPKAERGADGLGHKESQVGRWSGRRRSWRGWL